MRKTVAVPRREVPPVAQREALAVVGRESLDDLTGAVLPADIQSDRALALGEPRGEHEIQRELRAMAGRNEIYLAGEEDVSTYEYDLFVVAHEWGHYFEDRVGRSDSIGGSHALGDAKDARLAWSEGFASGLAAVVLEPDGWGTVYRDTYGPGQAYAFGYDIDDNSYKPNPGWWSEVSTGAIFFDLVDSDRLNHRAPRVTGVLADDCARLLTDFFAARR